MGCEWGEANHTYFQLANLFLAFTYFVPNSMKGLIFMRLFLGSAGFCFTMWAGVILCSPDTFGWNFIFMIINFAHVIYLLYTMRPIKFPEEQEVIFGNMFESLGVARWQFKLVASIAEKREWSQNEAIATEDLTMCEDLCIVTSGSVRVIKNEKFLHRIKAYEFINSPEWIKSTQSGGALPIPYEVTIISDGCVVISWRRNQLRNALRKGAFLKNIFDLLIGQDVTKKLFNTSQMVANSGGIPNQFYNLSDDVSRRSYSRIYDVNVTDSEIQVIGKNKNADCNQNEDGIVVQAPFITEAKST